MNLHYSLIIIASFLASVVTTWIVRVCALKFHIVDDPSTHSKKIHQESTPLLGGVGVFIGFLVGVLFFLFFVGSSLDEHTLRSLLGILVGALVLIIGGVCDDIYNLRAKHQLIFQLIAVGIVLVSGIAPVVITNPWGGVVSLPSIISLVFTGVWLLVLMNTMKVLDGMDGLVSGVSALASFFIFIVSLLWDTSVAPTPFLLLALMGAFLGFLVWNWHPAKIFLGESGGLFAGFTLGTLSILTGSKIATTALIVSLPLIDIIWVMFRRYFLDHVSVVNTGDQKHLHHILLRSGIGYASTVIVLYICTIVFGVASIVVGTLSKLVLFICIALMLFATSWYIAIKKFK